MLEGSSAKQENVFRNIGGGIVMQRWAMSHIVEASQSSYISTASSAVLQAMKAPARQRHCFVMDVGGEFGKVLLAQIWYRWPRLILGVRTGAIVIGKNADQDQTTKPKTDLSGPLSSLQDGCVSTVYSCCLCPAGDKAWLWLANSGT
jgi:hypothetical protein